MAAKHRYWPVTMRRSGVYARLPTLPYTPGADGAGVIEAVGPEVNNVKVGDRVYIALVGAAMGTYATKALVNANTVHPLPKSVSFAQGAGAFGRCIQVLCAPSHGNAAMPVTCS